jgi:hypothetical protein
MALQGALEEFGTIELLQFPQNGNKTCELVLTSEHGQAQIYYNKGRLVHARFHDKTGEGVIEEIIDWERGTFELKNGIESPDTTISKKDVQSLLLAALKARDERKLAEKQEQDRKDKSGKQFTSELEEYRRSTGFALHVSIINSLGEVVAEANDKSRQVEKIGELQQLIAKVLQIYPRKGLKKTFYEDESGVVGMTKLTESQVLLVAAEADRPLGVVALGLNRIAMQLSQKAVVQDNERKPISPLVDGK